MAVVVNEENTVEKEIREVIREISNTNILDEDFIEECGKLIEEEECEEVKEVIRTNIEEFLEKRKNNKKIIEDKDTGMAQMEEWHNELRAKFERKHKLDIERVKDRERNKRLSLLDLKKREDENEEYGKNMIDYLGEEVYKDLIDKFVFNENGGLNARDPVNYDLIVQNDKYINSHVVFN